MSHSPAFHLEALMMSAKEDIAISSGSACKSASIEPSYVLRACGVEEELAHASIRIGIGRFNTLDEIEHAASTLIDHVRRLARFGCRVRWIDPGGKTGGITRGDARPVRKRRRFHVVLLGRQNLETQFATVEWLMRLRERTVRQGSCGSANPSELSGNPACLH